MIRAERTILGHRFEGIGGLRRPIFRFQLRGDSLQRRRPRWRRLEGERFGNADVVEPKHEAFASLLRVSGFRVETRRFVIALLRVQALSAEVTNRLIIGFA